MGGLTLVKGETILFKFLGSDKVFTQEEVKDIIRKDPNALFIAHRVLGEPFYGFLGSDELYTLEEIRRVLNRDPLALFTVYQLNRGSIKRILPVQSMGDIDAETALQKYG